MSLKNNLNLYSFKFGKISKSNLTIKAKFKSYSHIAKR
ncbi:hypothetical protein CAMSH0001_1716 [Campylobacter showae RM3277]|uniref:Uncharacterized protein n=1 Tax=Campylobacter showae RM3277 TaxID=553219 RepID=C6REY2_9BACT|nr:hypothetical protein CAMSH0001_1716 [Campylobacter showae RM3277]